MAVTRGPAWFRLHSGGAMAVTRGPAWFRLHSGGAMAVVRGLPGLGY